MDEIKLLDVVVLVEDLDSEGLRRGEVGTVVEEWKQGVLKSSSATILVSLMLSQPCDPNR